MFVFYTFIYGDPFKILGGGIRILSNGFLFHIAEALVSKASRLIIKVKKKVDFRSIYMLYNIIIRNFGEANLFMNNRLTEENIKKLQEELDYRLTVVRAKIAKEKLEAAAHGDRSENAEYKEACANYRENDNRIQYLLTMLSTATVIDDTNTDKSTMGINSKAKVKFIEDDFETIVTLVTTLDLDPDNMCISIESELGKALSGKKAGEIVEVNAPEETYTVEILEIL
jgi:transcription elongation factor GreA